MKFVKATSFFIGIILIITSCEKQENWLDVAKAGAKQGVGFGETFIDGQPVYAAPDAGQINYALKAYLSGGSGSAKVSVVEDSSLVTAYNDANGTDIPKAPVGYYTVPSEINISGDSGSAAMPVNITGLYNDIGEFVYAVGVKISSVSGSTSYIQEGQQNLVLIITIQNQYDADYAVKGYFVHPSSPRAIAKTKHIYTLSAIRCEAEHSDLAGYYFDFDVDPSNKLINYEAAGGTPAAPQSGFMTIDNPTGVSTYPGPPYTSDIYNNTYDPDKKIFWMHYGYQSGASDQTGYTRQIYEKWTRQ